MMFAPPADMTETRTSTLNGRKFFLKSVKDLQDLCSLSSWRINDNMQLILST